MELMKELKDKVHHNSLSDLNQIIQVQTTRLTRRCALQSISLLTRKDKYLQNRTLV